MFLLLGQYGVCYWRPHPILDLVSGGVCEDWVLLSHKAACSLLSLVLQCTPCINIVPHILSLGQLQVVDGLDDCSRVSCRKSTLRAPLLDVGDLRVLQSSVWCLFTGATSQCGLLLVDVQ